MRVGKSIQTAVALYKMIRELEVGQTILLWGVDSILLERKEIKKKRVSYTVYDECSEVFTPTTSDEGVK